MAPLLEDPRIRQTWNQISQNAESATETAAAGIWNFQHTYIKPCFSYIGSGIDECAASCFPDREERARRLRERGRTRGRAESSFDFYDDWAADDGAGHGGLLGGWGNDELDRLLAGSGSHSGGSDGIDQAPRRKRGMSYGTKGARRKSLDPDPTIIPSTSALGFLGRLPFKFGGTLRYKPSAADLQDHPGALRAEVREEEEEAPLMSDEYSEEERPRGKGHSRQRSSTTSSGATSDSFRSRGDLFPSDGEDDAVPLSDEFAMVLERRSGTGADDRSSKGKRPSRSRTLSRNLSRTTQASLSRPSLAGNRTSSGTSLPYTSDPTPPDMSETPSLADLQQEEERIEREEDDEVERKRLAAARLAVERGLHEADESTSEIKPETPVVADIAIPSLSRIDHAQASDESPEIPSLESNEARVIPINTDGGVFVPARLPNFG